MLIYYFNMYGVSVMYEDDVQNFAFATVIVSLAFGILMINWLG